MIVKGLIVLYLVIQVVYEFTLDKIRDDYRKRPLPEEVSDIYDKNRYQQFLDYKSEYKKLANISEFVSILIYLFIFFSPFFQWMEHFTNVYVSLFVTIIILGIVDMIKSYIVSHYATFVIEEKYGMNKKTKQEFNKDFFLEALFEIPMEIVLYGVIVFICEHIVSWTNNFNISYIQSLLFVLGIVAVIALLFLGFSYLSLFILMKQYTFTNLEDEVLLNKINEMMKGVKKKIKGIKVYDESKKSTTKNAFVLKVPFYRIIGIADNFLNENAQRELYGVIAHEIGHLKHKKNALNYTKYLFIVLLVCFLVWLIPNGMIIKELANWINLQFGLTQTSYYLYFTLIGIVFEPIGFVLSVYNNYVTRVEEYEADQNAVKEGYGEDLIQLFKDLSRDELVDVNPSPIIETIEYDHPGMYQRILGLKGKRVS